jgi:hypothetical protein
MKVTIEKDGAVITIEGEPAEVQRQAEKVLATPVLVGQPLPPVFVPVPYPVPAPALPCWPVRPQFWWGIGQPPELTSPLRPYIGDPMPLGPTYRETFGDFLRHVEARPIGTVTCNSAPALKE